jgi:hypothetical protein
MYIWATIGSTFQITGRGRAGNPITTRDSLGPGPDLDFTIGHALITQGLGNIWRPDTGQRSLHLNMCWDYAVANNVSPTLKSPNTATKYIRPSKEKPEVTAMVTNISNPTPV